MNEPVKGGDRIILLNMSKEFGMPSGLKGTVTSVGADPFESDEHIIYVKWDNGSTLSLLSGIDFYKKISDKVNESDENIDFADRFKFMRNNKDLFKNFDWKKILKFLNIVKESGVVNMFGSAPFLYGGRNWIELNYGRDPSDPEAFEKVLELADEIKNEIIQGTMKSMVLKNEDDIRQVTRNVEKNARSFFILATKIPELNLPN